MSSSERLGAAPTPPNSGEAFIDWGLPLPEGYEGGRVRVMTVEPRMVRAAWELPRDGVHGWQVRAEGARGEELARLELGPEVSEAWLRVPAGTRGLLRLQAATGAGSTLLASLPFETPAEGPAGDREERWARVGADGKLTTVSAPPGRSADGLPGIGGTDRTGRLGGASSAGHSATHARRT
ncbi:MAG: hypothetical protein R3F39_22805 [Myxococcota bacterium]